MLSQEHADNEVLGMSQMGHTQPLANQSVKGRFWPFREVGGTTASPSRVGLQRGSNADVEWERVAISSDIVCEVQSRSGQTIHRIAESGRFCGTKRGRGNRRNPHVAWLPESGKDGPGLRFFRCPERLQATPKRSYHSVPAERRSGDGPLSCGPSILGTRSVA